MSKEFNTIADGVIRANRLIMLTKPADAEPDTIYIRTAQEGVTPEFVSTREIATGDTVKVRISNEDTWKVEAGADIAAGDLLSVAQYGKIVPKETLANPSAEVIGYALHSGANGDIVEFVRLRKVNPDWAAKVEGGGTA